MSENEKSETNETNEKARDALAANAAAEATAKETARDMAEVSRVLTLVVGCTGGPREMVDLLARTLITAVCATGVSYGNIAALFSETGEYWNEMTPDDQARARSDAQEMIVQAYDKAHAMRAMAARVRTAVNEVTKSASEPKDGAP